MNEEIRRIAEYCANQPELAPELLVEMYFTHQVIWSLEKDEWNRLTPEQKRVVGTAIISIEQETIS